MTNLLKEKENYYFKLIVDLYIETGEPVASKTLVERFKLNCSSATIRNVMARLEEINFLEKYHISGGRVPSTTGLEYYAKYLIYNPQKYFNEKLEDLLAKRRIKIDATLEEAASIVSEMVGVTVVATSNNGSETLKSIQLTPLTDSSAIVVIVTSTGRVESKMFNFENENIEINDLKIAIRLFKERLIDTPLIELSLKAQALMPIFSQQIKNFEIILEKFVKKVFVFEEETKTKSFNKGAIILSKNIQREELAHILDLIENHSVWETIENNLDEDNNIKLDVSRPNLSIISKKIDFANNENIKELSVVGPSNINFEDSFELLNMLEKILKEKKHDN
ncbi:heat inducible transcription repressor HrcA [Metamycoplasma cloacale]|uniref:Heat-inducible transcription repressor HrcA n=1 Tax=Metamycoplasma cloacale TaxID=92401 RepID=A0A2Z4LLY9_9BACT|nr:heat-inducible transcriptional repressor HrcA [Metamycoplasma cloacale]AWX42478.1 heat-inducible transcriptional repressor HrcA [Metamycoplasma cloacale]VEU79176.1 heat inducible transcription repressor HrcA [Metamycoplasma cloacale]